MHFLRTLLILTLLFVIGGCSGNDSGNRANSNSSDNRANSNRSVEPRMEGAKDNVEELRALVKMPFEPEDLIWMESAIGNSGETRKSKVLAVFQLSVEDAKKLIERVSKIRPGAPVMLTTERWFPPELVTQNELSNDEGIPATSYAADEFFQPPYSEGTLSRITDSDFFVLEVFAR